MAKSNKFKYGIPPKKQTSLMSKILTSIAMSLAFYIICGSLLSIPVVFVIAMAVPF